MKFNLFTAKSLANRHPEPKSDQLYLDIKIANYVRYKRRGAVRGNGHTMRTRERGRGAGGVGGAAGA